MTIKTEIKNNNGFDIMKIILSIFVVAIHSGLLISILNPIFRLAVPLFFMMSGYFFFEKLKYNEDTKEDRIKSLVKFIKRNITLYLFWFIVWLPVTVYVRGWYNKPMLTIVIDMIKKFLWGSTFRASWYIMALVTGVSVIFFVSNILSNRMIIMLSTVIYIACCFSSNYYGLIENIQYAEHFSSIVNSWPASVIWISIGKLIAENDIKFETKVNSIIGSVSLCTLYCEHLYVYKMGISKANDCYFSLIPLAIAIFMLVKNSNISFPYASECRRISVIIYVAHASIITILVGIMSNFGFENRLVIFILTIIIVGVLYKVICILVEKKYFKWLKYAY